MERPGCITTKKRYAYIFPHLMGRMLLLALALFIVGCTSTPAATQSTSPPSQNTPSTGAIEQAAAPGSVPVYVTLAEYTIISSVRAFHAGTTYYFVVTNHGHDIHELKIMPDKPDGTPLPASVQYKDTLFEIEPVMPGTTWTINYAFSRTSAGRYEMACQMRNHYQAGMRLPIVVIG